MLNPSDLHVYITDYNIKSLKNFSRVFSKYNNLTQWSASEIWAPKSSANVHDETSVDVYSFGMILWELETGKVPFKGLETKDLRKKLLEDKVRPSIPAKTDDNLKLLIRQCWQD